MTEPPASHPCRSCLLACLAGLVCMFVGVPHLDASEEGTSEQARAVLTRYKESLLPLKVSSYRVSRDVAVREFMAERPEDVQTIDESIDAIVIRHDDRIRIDRTSQFSLEGGEPSVESRTVIALPDFWISYDERTLQEHGAVGSREPGRMQENMLLNGPGPLDGFSDATGEAPIASALLSHENLKLSPPSQRPEKLPVDAVGVIAKTSDGAIEAWFSPAHNGGLVYLRRETKLAPPDSDKAPTPSKIVTTVEDLEYLEVEGSSIPVRARQTTRIEFTDGLRQVRELRAARRDLDLSPSFEESRFQPELPVGSIVHLADNTSGINYRWDGTRPVPETDPSAAAAAERASRSAREQRVAPSQPWAVYAGLATLAVIAAGVVAVWYWRR